MGSRTWIKIYCDKWLNGTIREESLEVRAVWIDLLVLAGSGKYGDSGEVKITDRVGFLDQQLADLMQISVQKWVACKKKLVETDRVEVSEKNIIHIINWDRYQSEYERTKPFRVTKSTAESTEKSTAIDRDKRLEIIDKENNKRKHGEFNNVLLSDEELKKLTDKFGEAGAKALIERLSAYLESSGRRYRSHYAAILNWQRRDVGKATNPRDLPKTYSDSPDYPDLR